MFLTIPLKLTTREQKILEFLQLKTSLFDLKNIPTLDKDHDTYQPRFLLLKGCVQSGKSRIIYSLCLYHTCIEKKHVMILLRNFSDDYQQFHRGLQNFLKECDWYVKDKKEEAIDIPSIVYGGKINKKKNAFNQNHPSIIIALSNYDQIRKINDWIGQNRVPFHIIVDEIDQIGYSLGKQFSFSFQNLMDNQIIENFYGISATLFEPFQNDKFCFEHRDVYYLLPPRQYKGITNIKYHYIEELEKKKEDVDLYKFLIENKNLQPFKITDNLSHPMICLIKTERLIAKQKYLMNMIMKQFKEGYTIITYNGRNCEIYSSGLQSESITLPVCNKKVYRKNYVYSFRNTGVSFVLQYLKNFGGAQLFPRILIIAFNLVGRGINIVSTDFGWHLTHMYYRPSKQTDVTTMIQSMRLCGIYQDDIPLKCYITKKDYENLYRGHMLQEDMFSRLEYTTNTDQKLIEWVQKENFYKEKIPKCHLYRNKKFKGQVVDNIHEDNGMSLQDFNIQKNKVDEIDGVKIKKLDKWKNSNTLVWKMVTFLYRQTKPIDLSTFKDGVEYTGSEKMFQSNIDNGKSIKARNGKLWVCKNNYGQIRMNPNIISYLSIGGHL